MLAGLAAMIAFFVGFGLVMFDHGTPYLVMLGWTLILMLSLVVFDSVVVDLLVIGWWRPSFLRIPAATTFGTMKIHVARTLTVGWLFILPIAGSSSAVVHVIL
jgi:hypothetical protein